jgi:hypothetical protein
MKSIVPLLSASHDSSTTNPNKEHICVRHLLATIFDMSQNVYFTKTAVGTFWIRPNMNNGWSLSIESDGDTELLNSYGSAIAAADDVYTQHTGCDEWDLPVRNDAPSDLGQWAKRQI